MQLPLDYSTLSFPVKSKYLAEETLEMDEWFIFGDYADGTVGICRSAGGNEDIMRRVPRSIAERIIAIRNAYSEAMVEAINAR